MSDEPSGRTILKFMVKNPVAAQVIEHVVQIAQLMYESDVSIGTLHEGFQLAIESGYDHAARCASMISLALEPPERFSRDENGVLIYTRPETK